MKNCTFNCYRRHVSKSDEFSRSSEVYGQCIPTLEAMDLLRPYSIVASEEDIIDVECEDVTDDISSLDQNGTHGSRW